MGEGNQREIRVARVIMNLGVEPSFVTARKGPAKWDAHKRAVWAAYEASPRSYLGRVERLAQLAHDQGAEVLLYPACALVFGSSLQVSAYFGPLSAVPLVFAGTYGGGSFRDRTEAAICLERGAVLHQFDSGTVNGIGMDGFSVMAAISSTISQARVGRVTQVAVRPLRPGQPILLLDMGHHQYSGRYTRTLESTVRAVSRRERAPCAAILAYWKYLRTRPRSSWTAKSGCVLRVEPPSVSPDDSSIQDIVHIISLRFRDRKAR